MSDAVLAQESSSHSMPSQVQERDSQDAETGELLNH